MIATILVVDDEPDLETLILQKFRRQIRDRRGSRRRDIPAITAATDCPGRRS
jgi:hypothetical protein